MNMIHKAQFDGHYPKLQFQLFIEEIKEIQKPSGPDDRQVQRDC